MFTGSACMPDLIEVTDTAGAIVQPDWLARSESVHRQLRPQLRPGYEAQMRGVFSGGGRMTIAVEDNIVVGVAVWRVTEKTFTPRELYVDDLVTDEGRRSTGIGRSLMDWMVARARALDCDVVTLDSGTQRLQAHRFYFREGMLITSFHFARQLKG